MSLHAWMLLLVMLPEAPGQAQADPATVQALRDVAALLDLYHRNGDGWTDYERDLNWCRRRQRELYDAPPVADVFRWPGREQAAKTYAFAVAHRDWLAAQELAYPHRYDELHACWQDAERRVAIWGKVADLACEQEHPHRRKLLRELRELLGPADFYAGRLPAPIPGH